jgi:mannose-6-phosphate isomerase class I
MFKNELPQIKQLADDRVGESWEFSCDPDFPSLTAEGQRNLPDLVRQYPKEILSPAFSQSANASCEILVKLLNAASPLSLQVHPRDDDPALAPHECGKPESWLILDAEPGAGLYLGFSRSLSQRELRGLLQEGDAAKDVLQFVPVRKGDYFEIEPGVPHAIGPGVTLLEPQRILFGKSGKTYRMWDWGRRYDASGQLDPENGQPRDLHLAAALRIVDPESQVGEAFVASLRRAAETYQLDERLQLVVYPENPYYQVRTLHAAEASRLRVRLDHGYGVLLCLAEHLQMRGRGSQDERLAKGYSSLIPYAAFPLDLELAAGSEVALIIPAGCEPEITAS